ncbi:MAG: hypothetical protein QM698_10245 [Micropepsaceae bacterium]
MTDDLTARAGVALFHDDADAARIAALLQGLGVTADPGSSVLVFFVSRAALANARTAETITVARAGGRTIVPVLLEPLAIPDEIPPALLPLDNPVEAFDETPPDKKRRALLMALSGAGVTAAGSGVAESATIGGETVARESTASASNATAPVTRIDPLAKSNAGVVKASSTRASRLFAYGGAAAATVLVIGAIVLLQNNDQRAAMSETGAGSPVAVSSTTTNAKEPDTGTPTPPRPTPAEIETGDARVILQQDSYPVGRAIPLRVVNMPGGNNDYVAIAEAGSPGYGELRYEYLRGRKEADITLRGVMKPGNYEVRLFFGNDLERNKSDVIRFSAPLTITPALPITLTPAATTLYEGSPLRVSFAGLPGNQKDWIATAEAGASDGEYISYTYTDGAEAGSLDLKPLMKPGAYEIRVYFDDLTSDRTVQARLPLEVLPAPPVNLVLDALTYAPGATITVSFNSMPGNKKDWFALARAGDDGYLTYDYTDGASSGTETFRAPDEPGDYENPRLFRRFDVRQAGACAGGVQGGASGRPCPGALSPLSRLCDPARPDGL